MTTKPPDGWRQVFPQYRCANCQHLLELPTLDAPFVRCSLHRFLMLQDEMLDHLCPEHTSAPLQENEAGVE